MAIAPSQVYFGDAPPPAVEGALWINSTNRSFNVCQSNVWRAAGQLTSATAGGGIGYATGAGATVTQASNKTTGVTINTVCGEIVMNNAQLNAGVEVVFTVTNSQVAAGDVVIVNMATVGTTGAYLVSVTAIAAGSFDITVSNASAGNLSEAATLNFAIIKAVKA